MNAEDADPSPADADLVEGRRALLAGRPELAEQACQRILRHAPDHADALNLSSLALGRLGRHAEAEQASRRAVALRPDAAIHLANLGEHLRHQQRYEEAIEVHRRVLAIAPDALTALDGLARALAVSGSPAEALEPARRASQLAPEIAGSHALLGTILDLLRRHDEAIAAFTRAVELEPDHADGWRYLARLYLAAGQMEALERAARHCLATNPDDAEAKVLLANALFHQGELGEARALLEGVPTAGVTGANARNLLGLTLARQGRLEAGLEALDWVAAHAPPGSAPNLSRLLYLNYDPRRTPQALSREHVAWAGRFAPSAPAVHGPRRPDPDRRLRIGYLSPDFWRHPVAWFSIPLFGAHDPQQVEVFGYASVARPDEVTRELARRADGWRNVRQLDDQALAEQIAADGIDILVELAGHTRGSRLLALTRRPAPVQVSYLGYPNTTGVAAIDHRITDHVADPEGFEQHYTETLIRLPRCFLAYARPAAAPAPGPPPMLARGQVTFGSFNNLAKLNRAVVALWARILREVAGSRLALKSLGTHDPETRRLLEDAFGDHGIGPERLDILPPERALEDHLRAYGRIDIALDPFPYNGTTTTCEALWMGVPVITLAGDRHAGRVGASLLTAIGASAGIAATPEAYVQAACRLAAEPEGLRVMRAQLRGHVSRSSLCDLSGHARAMEAAYRAMWRAWCQASMTT